MIESNHAVDIIEEKLTVSYEAVDYWESEDGTETEEIPAAAVLLVTRCCEINHDHIGLDKEQAMTLATWLVAFANGEYDD